MDRHYIREPIDACRSAGDDLRLPDLAMLADQIETDPEVREIFQRAQRLDGRIARAMHEAPLPAGLCDRILTRLVVEQPATVTGQPVPTLTQAVPVPTQPIASAPSLMEKATEDSAEVATVEKTDPQLPSRRMHRREWLVGVSAVAAMLLAGLGLWRLWPHVSPISVNTLLASSGRWHAQLADPAGWQSLTNRQGVKDFPPADTVRAIPRGWADVSAWVGRPAVAYDLNTGQGRRATLFVISEPGTSADSTPPRIPGSNTGGLMIGVWKADGLVYVLVVEGDQRRYDQLLDRSGQPMA